MTTNHGKVNMIPVLESIQQPDQPGRLCRSQDVSLHENVLDLVHLGQSGFLHLLERADLSCVGLSGEVDGSVASLTDLCEFNV
jgi:hypothetical protein